MYLQHWGLDHSPFATLREAPYPTDALSEATARADYLVAEGRRLRVLRELVEVPMLRMRMPMSRQQERLGRAIARALAALEFDPRVTDCRSVYANEVDEGHGGPRVEVRHPALVRDGVRWLVALVALEPAPRLTYAVPAYRDAIARTVERVCTSRGRS